jgi:DNA-binding beta-propeller fold protein YncE
MTSLRPPASPFGVAVTATGRWAFASLGDGVDVLRLAPGRAARVVRTIAMAGAQALGLALSPDGRVLLAADESGAVVIIVPAAEQGGRDAVLGTLSGPAGPNAGGIETAVAPGGRYAFVSLENTGQIAVFNLAMALAGHFGSAAYLGAIPAQVAPVGLAFSPDGRWMYSTSESTGAGQQGTLAVISVARAESDPAGSVLVRVPAGCNPVRVICSADGSVVWVTARASDALLAFSAARLQRDPGHALLADVRVGEAPVGLALAGGGHLIVVADSDRFLAASQSASLAVVGTADALAGRTALLGYLPAGGFPRDISAGPAGGMLLVADYSTGQLEEVSTASLP